MTDRFPDLPEGNGDLERMINGLRVKDPKLNALCARVLIETHLQSGVDLVPALVVEASLPNRRPDHRIRILDVIKKIGQPLSAGAFCDMAMLSDHQVERVASKAAEVIVALRPGANARKVDADAAESQEA